MSDEEKRKKLSPKVSRYIIGGCIAAALVAYIVITAIPEKQPAEENSPATTSSIKLPPDLFPDDDPTSQASQPGDGSNPGSQEETSDPNLVFKQDKVVLTAGLDSNGKDILACYVDRPEGYLISESGSSVTLWPEEMRLDVTGERPLSVSWLNVLYLDEMIAGGAYDDRKTGTYELVDSYECSPSDGRTAKVHITRHVPNDDDIMPYHMVSVDVRHGSLRPAVMIFDEDMHKFLSARYPDVQALARAIFVPTEQTAE